jgi:hypothetical protein
MWVRVTEVVGHGRDATYRGELWNIPLLISPMQLQSCSPVTFEGRHVHSL